MTMLKTVKTTASKRAKVAYGPAPSIIGSGPKNTTTPAETGVPIKFDITTNTTPAKINRKLKRRSLNKVDWKTQNPPDSSLR